MTQEAVPGEPSVLTHRAHGLSLALVSPRASRRGGLWSSLPGAPLDSPGRAPSPSGPCLAPASLGAWSRGWRRIHGPVRAFGARECCPVCHFAQSHFLCLELRCHMLSCGCSCPGCWGCGGRRLREQTPAPAGEGSRAESLHPPSRNPLPHQMGSLQPPNPGSGQQGLWSAGV